MRKPTITQKPRYYIGIDPGVNTGFALWDSEAKEFVTIETGKIHNIMFTVKKICYDTGEFINSIVVIEDARKRKHDKGLTPEKAQGAGSVKRDCKIWEDFLTELGIPFQLKAPNGKLNAFAQAKNLKLWQSNCKWTKQTSEHARCAAMLVWNI